MTQMRRNLLSVLARHDDESTCRDQEAFDCHAETFERLMAAFDRFEARFGPEAHARPVDDRVAELETWCAASRIRRRELLEKARAYGLPLKLPEG